MGGIWGIFRKFFVGGYTRSSADGGSGFAGQGGISQKKFLGGGSNLAIPPCSPLLNTIEVKPGLSDILTKEGTFMTMTQLKLFSMN